MIVDDGSSDATPAILDGLADARPADPRAPPLAPVRAPDGDHRGARPRARRRGGDDRRRPPGPARADPGARRDVARRGGHRGRQAPQRSGETRFKLATARWFYAIMGRLAQVELDPNAGDFRLIDRAPLDALLRLRERSRFLRGMSSWVGFSRAVVEYDRDARTAGETKYPLRKMLRFALDGLTSFSNFPLQLAALAGFACAALALLGLPLTIVARYSGIYERGVPSLLFAVLLIGGIQLLALGMLGEYLGRIYDEVKQRPLYVVARSQNLDPEEGASAALAGVERRDPEARVEGRGHRRRRRGARVRAPADRGRPHLRRLRALARPRRAGRDDRRRRRPPARALLPPPVHERPPHRRALRRARDAGRARVAPVLDGVLPRGPLVAVHDAAAPAALRAAVPVLARPHGARGAEAAEDARATSRRSSA